MSLGSLKVPAFVEFLARCALAARRRYLPPARPVEIERQPAPQRIMPESLAASFAELGIHPGDVLMVHSGMPAVERLGWGGNPVT